MAAAIEAPAAGAPMLQVLLASLFAALTTGGLMWLVVRHRSGRGKELRVAGAVARYVTGLPPWAGLPLLVTAGALVSGAFGVFWDIALHIDEGRDVGPLANPSHYFLLLALYGVFAAGVLAIVLHENANRPAPRPLRLPGGYNAPVGGVLLLLCGVFSLTGFPLDDMWHRMFGQDVTLWGPTHLVMINGAILSLPALMVLVLEAKRAAGRKLADPPDNIGELSLRLLLPASLLFAIAFWATEFDWGVPQYRQVWHPLLLAAASSIALVAARLWTGPWGALRTVGIYIAMRLALTAIVGGLGQTMPAIPLFVVEALCVELVARRRAPEESPLRFGLMAGALCGTVGFAAEYGWSHVVSPYPWTPALLPEGIPTALLAGLAGGVLGALLGAALRGELPERRVRRPAALVAALTLVLLGANALVTTEPRDIRATVALERTGGGDEAYAVARVDGADPGDAEWFTALSWQGGGRVVSTMELIGGGRWRSADPLPLHGEWKTMLRLHDDRALVAIPLHLPRDEAIDHPGLTRPAAFTATFVPDGDVMQTERRDYAPGWLWTPAALLMLLFCGLFITALSLGLARAVDPAPARPRAPAATGSPPRT